MFNRYSTVPFAIFLFALWVVFFIVSPWQDRERNRVSSTVETEISEKALAFHDTLFVADMHADSLLWDRNLLERHDYGHVDIPRLKAGRVRLQVFSIVTKTPKNINLFENSSASDNITLLAVLSRWPVRTWNSLLQRALYQSDKLHQLETESKGQLQIILSKEDLEKTSKSDSKIAGILAVEGGHALEGDLNNLDVLFENGIRMVGFTHFFDNALGGSAHGLEKGGITEFGLAVMRRMEQLGVVVDVAHASNALLADILRYAQKPVVSSHTGLSTICNDSPRNLSDEQALGIAATGGLLGIGFWPHAVCGNSIEDIMRTIEYAVNLVGIDHIALGSDFDGNVQTPFASDQLVLLTQAFLAQGYSENDIKKIMGHNIRRLFLDLLPPSAAF
ncbi:dipeptidase [Candidatus Spongiihabitans sp.]|uniref:dipeptidase n=1 Tax=Candidatus Spongiihabitans sp. TaxID=3101308 RepID=UPI003C6EF6A6